MSLARVCYLVTAAVFVFSGCKARKQPDSVTKDATNFNSPDYIYLHSDVQKLKVILNECESGALLKAMASPSKEGLSPRDCVPIAKMELPPAVLDDVVTSEFKVADLVSTLNRGVIVSWDGSNANLVLSWSSKIIAEPALNTALTKLLTEHNFSTQNFLFAYPNLFISEKLGSSGSEAFCLYTINSRTFNPSLARNVFYNADSISSYVIDFQKMTGDKSFSDPAFLNLLNKIKAGAAASTQEQLEGLIFPLSNDPMMMAERNNVRGFINVAQQYEVVGSDKCSKHHPASSAAKVPATK